jgi:lipid-A-disaccharide synthase-like uncharacterized protein
MNFAALTTTEIIWLAVGFGGQALFTMRFLIQWIYSEKHQKSLIPDAFWYFSIGGGILLLSYALYRQDPVFILGQSMGVFVYLRNLYFIRRHKGGGPDAGGGTVNP